MYLISRKVLGAVQAGSFCPKFTDHNGPQERPQKNQLRQFLNARIKVLNSKKIRPFSFLST